MAGKKVLVVEDNTRRGESDVLIIMLTARTTDEDELPGLGLGADDYLINEVKEHEANYYWIGAVREPDCR